jgi:rhamnopyranosyl-N-acetylglucosaminyl-diphospho-decaprenol beta-1,3/1,4-galactofuranosyltransferase
MKIIAFVVTYNRISLLPKVIDSLKSQTYKIDEIVVVNNSSTDGTLDWLIKQKNITVITQENLGGAGGFNKGVEYAFNNNADWIWMMDDDVYPKSDALEKLMKYKNISECIIPWRYFSDNKDVNWGGIFDIEKFRLVRSTKPSNQNDKYYYPVNTCCFEGTLISKNIVSKIGFPDKRFFIAGDDSVYGLKASLHTNLILVKEAHLIRDKTSRTNKILSPLFLYYRFRNFHLFNEYNKVLNNNNFSLIVKLKVFLSFFIYGKQIILTQKNKIKLFKAIILGILDSILKKTGPTHHNKI